MSYDFYIPGGNVLIEYQGSFHDNTARLQTQSDYQIQLEHDRRKRSYAEANDIRLIEIWYDEDIAKRLESDLRNIINPVTTTVS